MCKIYCLQLDCFSVVTFQGVHVADNSADCRPRHREMECSECRTKDVGVRQERQSYVDLTAILQHHYSLSPSFRLQLWSFSVCSLLSSGELAD
jgi:hypothetical protein